jgi:hypothetical protein
MSNEDRLVDLASRVSDCTETDWGSAEREAESDEDRIAIRNLGLLDSIARVHRSLQGESGRERQAPSRRVRRG